MLSKHVGGGLQEVEGGLSVGSDMGCFVWFALCVGVYALN